MGREIGVMWPRTSAMNRSLGHHPFGCSKMCSLVEDAFDIQSTIMAIILGIEQHIYWLVVWNMAFIFP